MFNNPGEKIKKFAKILFWILCVAFVILAIVFGWTYDIWSSQIKFNPLSFFGLIIGGFVFSYILSLFLSAFGELVQNSHSIKEILKQNDKQKQVVESQEKETSTTVVPEATKIPPVKHKWRCPKCGNMIFHDPCLYCGESSQK